MQKYRCCFTMQQFNKYQKIGVVVPFPKEFNITTVGYNLIWGNVYIEVVVVQGIYTIIILIYFSYNAAAVVYRAV